MSMSIVLRFSEEEFAEYGPNHHTYSEVPAEPQPHRLVDSQKSDNPLLVGAIGSVLMLAAVGSAWVKKSAYYQRWRARMSGDSL